MHINHHASLLKVNTPRSFVSADDFSGAQHTISIEKFGIDEVRELMQIAYQRPIKGKQQLLIIQTDFITFEAQNALLKVLEDPPLSTNFLFVVPWDLVIIPTLYSRFQEVSDDSDAILTEANNELDVLLSQSYKERIAAIELRLRNNDTAWQRAIKVGLLQYLLTEKPYFVQPNLEYCVRTLLTRGASNKMLLEQIALLLPVS